MELTGQWTIVSVSRPDGQNRLLLSGTDRHDGSILLNTMRLPLSIGGDAWQIEVEWLAAMRVGNEFSHRWVPVDLARHLSHDRQRGLTLSLSGGPEMRRFNLLLVSSDPLFAPPDIPASFDFTLEDNPEPQ
jgi:hypothetical protein